MTSDENSDICSSVTNDIGNKDDNHQDEDGHNELQHKLHIVNEFITAMIMQTCEYLQFLVLFRSIVPAFKRRRRRKRICRPNLHPDRSSVLSFIHSWTDEMFKRQFCMTRPVFFFLWEATIMENMERNRYDYEKHNSFATRSSRSPISLELRLYITL